LDDGEAGKDRAQVFVPCMAELSPLSIDWALVESETDLQFNDQMRFLQTFEQ